MIKIPNPERVHRRNINKEDFNWLFFFNIFIAVVLSIYLAWKDVKAGFIYSFMFFGISSMMSWLFFWIKDDNNLKPITDYIRIPISSKMTLAGLFYIIGFGAPLLVQSVLRVVGSSYNISNLSIPLFSVGIDQAFQTFSTAEIGSNMSWRIFLTMFAAGNMETFVYNFGLPMMGVIIAIFTFNIISTDGKKVLFISKKWFVFIFGVMVIPIVLFVLSHLMNANYTFWQFVIAGIFLMVANITIYKLGVFALFWAGYHQSSNLVAMIMNKGFLPVAEGFVGWFGMIFLVYFGLIIYFLIRNSDKVWMDLKWWARN